MIERFDASGVPDPNGRFVRYDAIEKKQDVIKKMATVIRKMSAAIWDAYEPGCDCPTCALAEILNEIEEEE